MSGGERPRSPNRDRALALLVSILLFAALEGLLAILPSPESRPTPRVVLDRQGGLEEMERAALAEAGGGGSEALAANRIYREDERTFWRLRRGARVTGRNYLVPKGPREAIPFTMTIDPNGFRGEPLPERKAANALRVIAVGNSSTFGWGVDDDETYPRALRSLLSAALPSRTIEVQNAGIPGFTSFQGERLLQGEILPLAPDVVVLSFGFNDSRRAACTDSAFALINATTPARLARAASRLRTYRWLSSLLRSRSGRDRLSPGAAERTVERVPVAEFEARLRGMVRAVRSANARPILLAMVVPTPYGEAIAHVARAENVPFLDTAPLLRSRIQDPVVRGRFAAAIARHEAAWRDVPAASRASAAYADAIHPSPVGHAIIAEWVAGVITGGPAPGLSAEGR